MVINYDQVLRMMKAQLHYLWCLEPVHNAAPCVCKLFTVNCGWHGGGTSGMQHTVYRNVACTEQILMHGWLPV